MKDEKVEAIIDQIELYFPELFEYEEGEGQALENVEIMVEEANKMFNNSKLIHISAPQFHKKWDELIGDLDDLEGREDDIRKAKQEWSMSVNRHIEKFATKIKNICVLQAGGGHLLIAVNNEGEEKTTEMAKNILHDLREQWVALRGWAPALWATWDDGTVEIPIERRANITPEKIIDGLLKEHKESYLIRKTVNHRWAIFGYNQNTAKIPEDEEGYTIYLDVISLGEECWPKKKKCSECGKEWHTSEKQCPDNDCANEWKEPQEGESNYISSKTGQSRTRKETIEGFKNSRHMTVVIESTFGVILSSYTPNNIQSMGGDELIADISSEKQWIEIIDEVERQCSILYSRFINKKPRLLWWAMILPVSEFESESIKGIKDTVRDNCDDWGTRFVNPLWSKLAPNEPELDD